MWFWFAIITLLCWSGSDFFSKIGCRDAKDKYSQFKMVMAVGVVMGLHAAYEIFFNGVTISWQVIWTYLPVSLLYIGSMAMGYVGLRYIELSISSPICNASGALVAIIAILTGTSGEMDALQYVAVALACIGVISLGFVEAKEDEDLRAARQEASNYKYAKSWLALALPVAYCVLDAAGTFADDVVLTVFHLDFINANTTSEFAHLFTDGIPEAFETLAALLEESGKESFVELFAAGIPETLNSLVSVDVAAELENFIASNQLTPQSIDNITAFISEMEEASASSANVAYELTFLAAGIVCFIYTVIIKKQKLVAKVEGPKYVGAIFETAGQFTYIMALASGNAALAAPIISSYCMASVLWSRIFLKEKLSWKHYACIAVTFAGILIMGIYDM